MAYHKANPQPNAANARKSQHCHIGCTILTPCNRSLFRQPVAGRFFSILQADPPL